MSTIYTNSGLKLFMESVRGSALPIVSITKAAPGVVTSTAHGLLDGDVVYLQVDGMSELDGRAFVVLGKTTDTFELAGIDGATGVDTSAYSTFSAGNAYKITLGTSITGVKEFSPKGGDVKLLDTTTVHDKKDKQVVVGSTAVSYDLTMNWDPADAGQAAMIAAFTTGSAKVFKILWPNGRFALFNGTVGYGASPGGSNQGVTTSPAAVALTGDATYSI